MKTLITSVNPQPTYNVFKPYNLSLGAKANQFAFVTGQVGFNDDGSFPDDANDQVVNVFKHLDRIIESLTGSWTNVIQMRSFHLGTHMEQQAPKILEEKAKRMPNHQHAWTAIGVTQLMPAGSQLEIDLVIALDEGE